MSTVIVRGFPVCGWPSAEGSPIGTPNEVAQFNGVEVPVADQLKYFYEAWGSDKTYNHMAVGWTWAFDTPFQASIGIFVFGSGG